VGALLSQDGDAELVVVRDEADVSIARQAVRARAATQGLARDRAEALVTAVSEVAHNQLRHAGRGEMHVRSLERDGTKAVEVQARDRGGGIADPSAALRGRQAGAPATSAGLGIGLAGAYRLADEIDFDVRQGEGTTLWLRKFATPVPRSEVAILGRPIDSERVSGDDACFARRSGGLLLAVADGLGHGPLAHEPAARAIALVAAASSAQPAELLHACQPALLQTRGAVMAIVHVQAGDGSLVHAGLGNVSCQLHGGRTVRRLPSNPGVVGQAGGPLRVHEYVEPLEGRYVLAMFTDGLTSRLDLGADPALLREPPLVIAHQLLVQHGRSHDDALVLVAVG
jgi:anti-sigma regulatory factor (Ser/Thr protein kinase)